MKIVYLNSNDTEYQEEIKFVDIKDVWCIRLSMAVLALSDCRPLLLYLAHMGWQKSRICRPKAPRSQCAHLLFDRFSHTLEFTNSLSSRRGRGRGGRRGECYPDGNPSNCPSKK